MSPLCVLLDLEALLELAAGRVNIAAEAAPDRNGHAVVRKYLFKFLGGAEGLRPYESVKA